MVCNYSVQLALFSQGFCFRNYQGKQWLFSSTVLDPTLSSELNWLGSGGFPKPTEVLCVHQWPLQTSESHPDPFKGDLPLNSSGLHSEAHGGVGTYGLCGLQKASWPSWSSALVRGIGQFGTYENVTQWMLNPQITWAPLYINLELKHIAPLSTGRTFGKHQHTYTGRGGGPISSHL